MASPPHLSPPSLLSLQPHFSLTKKTQFQFQQSGGAQKMKPRNRKLLYTTNEYPDPQITLTNPPIPPLLVPNNATAKKPAKPPEPFDSSMALTVVVLFTAFFFMGLFSIYIRRFADDNPVDFSRRRRRQNADIPISVAGALSEIRRARGGGGGVDTSTILPLPVCAYHGDAKRTIIDCAICLSEFEDEEEVKMIPSCGHVFHPSCIDTWLSSRVSCPLCRTTRLIPAKDVGISGSESTAESGDTCTSSMRRSDSYSSLEEP